MISSSAVTVEEYLQSLPDARRKTIEAVRSVILQNLPPGYEEMMQYGMISYVVPFSIFPDAYNKQPLTYCSLASQKNYCSLYLMNIYSSPELLSWFSEGFDQAGKKLTMGKSCVQFKSPAELPLNVIGAAIARTSVSDFIRMYKHSRKN